MGFVILSIIIYNLFIKNRKEKYEDVLPVATVIVGTLLLLSFIFPPLQVVSFIALIFGASIANYVGEYEKKKNTYNDCERYVYEKAKAEAEKRKKERDDINNARVFNNETDNYDRERRASRSYDSRRSSESGNRTTYNSYRSSDGVMPGADRNDAGYRNSTAHTPGFTRNAGYRKDIVTRFNIKLQLNLTEEEIIRIVDASYVSGEWEHEIYCMNLNYVSIYEWYNYRKTSWLRAYLKAFPVQNISSDFEMQEQICLDSLTEVFTRLNFKKYHSVKECITAVNNKYFTSFDDITFMIAYRFLEENGVKVDLPKTKVVKVDETIDDLKDRYDNTEPAVIDEDPRVRKMRMESSKRVAERAAARMAKTTSKKSEVDVNKSTGSKVDIRKKTS